MSEQRFWTLWILYETLLREISDRIDDLQPIDCEYTYGPCTENCTTEILVTKEPNEFGKQCPNSPVPCYHWDSPSQFKDNINNCPKIPLDCREEWADKCRINPENNKCVRKAIKVEPTVEDGVSGKSCELPDFEDCPSDFVNTENDVCPVDCVGHWSKCASNCKRYWIVDTPAKGGYDLVGNYVQGKPCSDENYPILKNGFEDYCDAGEDFDGVDGCPPNSDCVGNFGPCDKNCSGRFCEREFVVEREETGSGNCYKRGTTSACVNPNFLVSNNEEQTEEQTVEQTEEQTEEQTVEQPEEQLEEQSEDKPEEQPVEQTEEQTEEQPEEQSEEPEEQTEEQKEQSEENLDGSEDSNTTLYVGIILAVFLILVFLEFYKSR